MPLSRRSFLKYTGALTLGLTAAPALTALAGAEVPPPETALPFKLGRVTWPIPLWSKPSFTYGKKIGSRSFNSIVNIYQITVGDTPKHNPVWFKVDRGWLQSSSVQPVWEIHNPPEKDVPPGGFLAEVTVPRTDTWFIPEKYAAVPSYFCYGSTHWIDEIITDDKAQVWYRSRDDFGVDYFVLAAHLRRIPESELTPLSPDVKNKRIEIDLKKQRLTALENGVPVLACRIATGIDVTPTPRGTFNVQRKRPSRHMATGTDVVGAEYNLPGVPWVCYITTSGVSLHGTYWHNDYGRPNSAGCLNLPLHYSKWIYRWVTPVLTPSERFKASDEGTEVVVF